jgi:predicted nucleic acid-binding protein
VTTVLDTYALLAYLGGEPGADAVRALLAEATETGVKLLMTSVNVGEAFYIEQRKHGEARLPLIDDALGKLPIKVVDVDRSLAKAAAALKATRRMSFADCFAVALAQARGGRLVTGDREFQAVEPETPIVWLPRPR